MFKLRSALVALALVASAAVAVVSLSPPAKAIDPGTAALVAGGMKMAQAVMHPQQRPPQYGYGYEQRRPVYRYRYGYQQHYYQQRRYVQPRYYGYQQRRVVRNTVPYYPPAVVSAPRYNEGRPAAQGTRENMTVVGFNPGTSQCLAPKRIVPSNECTPRPDGGMRCKNVCM